MTGTWTGCMTWMVCVSIRSCEIKACWGGDRKRSCLTFFLILDLALSPRPPSRRRQTWFIYLQVV